MPEEKQGNTSTDTLMDKNSELNFLNGKRTFDEFQDVSLTAARRSQSHFDDLSSRTLGSLDQLQTLQAKINEEHFSGVNELRARIKSLENDRARYTDDANYVTRYDLSNPVTTGAGDALRSAAYTPNRTVDMTGGVASGAVAADISAIAGAVAKQVDATVTPVLAMLQQMLQTMTNMQASIANVLNQSQPKA